MEPCPVSSLEFDVGLVLGLGLGLSREFSNNFSSGFQGPGFGLGSA